MNYMLDSCTFIWYIETSERLPESVRELINTSESMSVSIATFWEIAIKHSIGKIGLNMTMNEIEAKCGENDITILPIKLAYLERTKSLPMTHKDPFDRIIMATDIEEDLILLTCDSQIVKYDEVNTLWEITKED